TPRWASCASQSVLLSSGAEPDGMAGPENGERPTPVEGVWWRLEATRSRAAARRHRAVWRRAAWPTDRLPERGPPARTPFRHSVDPCRRSAGPPQHERRGRVADL